MSESDPDHGFSVVDRRRRGAEAPPAVSRASVPGAAPPTESAAVREASAPKPEDSEATGGAGPPRAELASLCAMLYSDALMRLGQVPDPVTGQPQRDLEQARFAIDLLGVLRQKTEGNRTPQESSMLEEILATLQMAYVRANRR